ncbi:MAG: aspartyl protease family protein [Clostridia bacterium]|nr:aspartyl protease family protein [Clostridia bacterium]
MEGNPKALNIYKDNAFFKGTTVEAFFSEQNDHKGLWMTTEVRINGKSMKFLVDTGAYYSQIFQCAASQFLSDKSNSIDNKYEKIVVKKANVGGVSVKNLHLFISEDRFDRYTKKTPYVGLIGMDFFCNNNNAMYISFDKREYGVLDSLPSNLETVPVAFPANLPMFTVKSKIEGNTYIAWIDSGAGTILLDNRCFNYSPEFTSSDTNRIGTNELEPYRGKTLKSITIGNLTMKNTKAIVKDKMYESTFYSYVLGGEAFWGNRTVYLDFNNGKIAWAE